ncbi:14890_t:CDS:2, partial [Gigaspora margarita]
RARDQGFSFRLQQQISYNRKKYSSIVRYRLTRSVTMDEEIFTLGVEQDPSKNNESKMEDTFIKENSHPLEIIDKHPNQVSEKVKEHIVPRENTN